ncbi:hypothetical protein ACFY05_42040 [Microtetraspora fusca]|uniref:DUF4355 domain-containing protein n=1 Tax=Microtetraspora fusca TaxID=1997 RepID=A0ABW6VLC7_MICFU
MTMPVEGQPQPTHPVEGAPQEPAQAPETTPAEEIDWKAKAREWEKRAKENKTAADKLAEIEEANKTEAQKLTERATKAEERATEAEARALRREVALEHRLGKDDAALLDAITDEDAMRRLAERLAQQQKAAETTVGAYVPGMGKSPAAPNLDAQIAEAEAKGDTKTAVALKTRKLTQPQN